MYFVHDKNKWRGLWGFVVGFLGFGIFLVGASDHRLSQTIAVEGQTLSVEDAIPLVAKKLFSPDVTAQRLALRAIQSIASHLRDNRQVVDRIEELYKSQDQEVSREALGALFFIGAPQSIVVFNDAVQSKHVDFRLFGAWGLIQQAQGQDDLNAVIKALISVLAEEPKTELAFSMISEAENSLRKISQAAKLELPPRPGTCQ